jgi:rubrerythrin
MGNIFSGSDIVKLGVQIEENGRDFYDILSKQSKDGKTIDVFKYLKGEEERHIIVFQEILESLEKTEPAESYEGEYINYMKALADEHVFTKKGKGKEIARAVTADAKAIDIGIGFEKDSIVFYEGMKKVVPEYDIKIVEELIKQEQDHLRRLSELKDRS